MELAILANDNPDEDFALFIDEINRANRPGKVMGALMTIIETPKRICSHYNFSCLDGLPSITSARWFNGRGRISCGISTQNGDNIYFGLPTNLYIVGAMNTSDRSVIHLDGALREAIFGTNRHHAFRRMVLMTSFKSFKIQMIQDIGWMSTLMNAVICLEICRAKQRVVQRLLDLMVSLDIRTFLMRSGVKLLLRS